MRIILSYHVFGDKHSDYKFSRTYNQFWHDINKKIYDEIHIDDRKVCTIKVCEYLREVNRRAKLFVCTSLIGTEGYCTWDDLRALSKYHDIENHGTWHRNHANVLPSIQLESIDRA